MVPATQVQLYSACIMKNISDHALTVLPVACIISCIQTTLYTVDLFTSSGALVVEEDPIAGKHLVSLSVVNGDPVTIQLGST